jgi:hypothetical protein
MMIDAMILLFFVHHLILLVHTQLSRFITEGVVGTSQIFLRDTHILTKDIRNNANATGNNPIADRPQSISGVSAVNPLVAFYVDE